MITKEQAFGMYLGVDLLTPSGVIVKLTSKFADFCQFEESKLILRPLSELTGYEILEFWRIRKPKAERISVPYTDFTKLSPQETEYLISIGIDIFNLKERGWAVYESELKEEKK